MPFARAVCDLVEQQKATCKGQPLLPESGVPPAFYTIQTEWVSDDELWQFVDFKQLFTYLRGSKRLNMPIIWRTIIPDRL